MPITSASCIETAIPAEPAAEPRCRENVVRHLAVELRDDHRADQEHRVDAAHADGDGGLRRRTHSPQNRAYAFPPRPSARCTSSRSTVAPFTAASAASRVAATVAGLDHAQGLAERSDPGAPHRLGDAGMDIGEEHAIDQRDGTRLDPGGDGFLDVADITGDHHQVAPGVDRAGSDGRPPDPA